MKPIQKKSGSTTFKATDVENSINVKLSVVTDKERQNARIPTYDYILP